ncbi:MAG TPA: hypothetical protein VM529_10085 [Gemmata sp.]|nr:hypothetical protein [Gemmata sp.]
MNATFSHTGRRPQVGYSNRGKLFGHDVPKAGRVHALNVGGFRGFTALCGEQVEPAAAFTEYGDEIAPECRSVRPGADAGRVTCKRCVKILAG